MFSPLHRKMAAINLSFVLQLIETHFAVKRNLNSNIFNTHINKSMGKNTTPQSLSMHTFLQISMKHGTESSSIFHKNYMI